MISVFVNFQEMLEVAGLKCEEVIVDKESFMRLQASMTTYMRVTQEPVQPVEEISICGLTITYKDKE